MPVPVICVGNLTLGGTGKTVVAEYVARFYRDRNRTVAILSRGYGGDGRPNDEALVLEENLPDVPHLQGADRVSLANTAVEELESEVLILDDGFQHRRLYRDLDVVLIDTTRPLADEYLFPRGLLREPISSLKRAVVAVFTRCDQVPAEELRQQVEWLKRRFPQLPICLTRHEPISLIGAEAQTADVSELQGKSVVAFCGLGNPESFRRTVTDLGATVTDFRTFPDHHPYTRDDVENLGAWAASTPADTIVVTSQKDWVKLRVGELGGRKLWAVRVGLTVIGGKEVLHQKLESVVPNLDSGSE
jgi:tetraacyldisaccharide 4'-kinase